MCGQFMMCLLLQTFNSSVTYQHLVADNPDVRPNARSSTSAVDVLCLELTPATH